MGLVSRRNSMGKTAKIIILAFAALIISGFIFWDVPRNKVAMFLERDAIEKTAHAYLNAEVKKDSKEVYALLAPSSDYKRTHSYEEFLKDIAENPPLSINEYKIMRIYRLRSNDNRQNYPGVDKFVQVEVEITFKHAGPNSIYNYSFTFLKEKGNWYKG
jgi:HEPN domain-containing protein